jgi:hypothetical protein
LGRKTDSAVKDGGVAADVDLELDVRYNKWKATAWVNGCRVYLIYEPSSKHPGMYYPCSYSESYQPQSVYSLVYSPTYRHHFYYSGVLKQRIVHTRVFTGGLVNHTGRFSFTRMEDRMSWDTLTSLRTR